MHGWRGWSGGSLDLRVLPLIDEGIDIGGGDIRVRRMAPIGKESLVIRADATMVEKKAATSKRSWQRRGPQLWPERALAVIFEAGEEVEEAKGEGSGAT
ncbi:hypothetical protein B296_00037440 [Ensete ventricosum]|uniref:Uncharacterized protein n=1 Tax=Ensete ventricosum TaxID=4639 RepID=A0A426ZF93_ENSVE|nr:hypothetical protein B296_00037440 [Ensete ventricosum]